jgi:uncharacterized protein
MRGAWPWYVTGPMIGMFVPLLLLVGNRLFGFSSNFRHLCAIVAPKRIAFFQYDWRKIGGWNLAFILGALLGGVIGATLLSDGSNIRLSAAAQQSLAALGVRDFSGVVPQEFFSWPALFTLRGVVMICGGGFLVGFGAAYAGGCTSGHAISGLADFQLPSLLAVVGFFAGGLISTWFVLPRLLG